MVFIIIKTPPCSLVTPLIRVENDEKLTQPYFVLLSLCRINSQVDKKEEEEDGEQRNKGSGQGKKDVDNLDSDGENDDDDLSDPGDEDDDEGEDFHDSESKKTKNKSDVLPEVSQVNITD